MGEWVNGWLGEWVNGERLDGRSHGIVEHNGFNCRDDERAPDEQEGQQTAHWLSGTGGREGVEGGGGTVRNERRESNGCEACLMALHGHVCT